MSYYLKGRYFWYRRYEKGAGLYFQLAAEKDPGMLCRTWG